MSETNKTIARRYVEELWNRKNVALADELIAPNCVLQDPATPNLGTGPAGVKQLYNTYVTAFPDTQFKIEDLIAEGDKVVLRWSVRGTHKGKLEDIAPTNKTVTVTGIDIMRISNNKIQELVANWDALGLMQQLGAIPATATKKAGKGA
jgi:steroid delta-isomerase-like uncharacterized protein